MAAPLVLLVDDSDAVLAYERAALSGHYTIQTASDGAKALEAMAKRRPALVLLDLSMPVMDGDDVLARMKAAPALSAIPVVVVSSELARGHACVKAGAAAFAPKPVRAEALLALVNRVYDEATTAAAKRRLGAPFVSVGQLELALPVGRIHTVFHQPATRPLHDAGPWSIEAVDLHGEPVCLLDLSRRLGVSLKTAMIDRKVVVIDRPALKVGFSVDQVRDPEEIDPSDVTPVELWNGPPVLPIAEAVTAVVSTDRGPRALVDPDALFPAELLASLSSLVGRVVAPEVP